MPEAPYATIRRAAALMRERALAVGSPSGAGGRAL